MWVRVRARVRVRVRVWGRVRVRVRVRVGLTWVVRCTDTLASPSVPVQWNTPSIRVRMGWF